MIYEMRIYTCVPGRLSALLRRFEDHTIRYWRKHGIRLAGFWLVEVGDARHEVQYMLAWESLAERETKWPAFLGDQEWDALRIASEKDGPMVAHVRNMILSPTAFSPMQ